MNDVSICSAASNQPRELLRQRLPPSQDAPPRPEVRRVRDGLAGEEVAQAQELVGRGRGGPLHRLEAAVEERERLLVLLALDQLQVFLAGEEERKEKEEHFRVQDKKRGKEFPAWCSWHRGEIFSRMKKNESKQASAVVDLWLRNTTASCSWSNRTSVSPARQKRDPGYKSTLCAARLRVHAFATKTCCNGFFFFGHKGHDHLAAHLAVDGVQESLVVQPREVLGDEADDHAPVALQGGLPKPAALGATSLKREQKVAHNLRVLSCTAVRLACIHI